MSILIAHEMVTPIAATIAPHPETRADASQLRPRVKKANNAGASVQITTNPISPEETK